MSEQKPLQKSDSHPKRQKRYTLEQLIAQCDSKAPHTIDRDWLFAPRTGHELF
jgi:hypothetical protein